MAAVGDGVLLVRAARRGDAQEVARLLARGADIHAVDQREDSVLHASVRAGDADITALLAANGADIHARDYWGHQPLYVAAVMGSVACLEVLLQRGADVGARGQREGEPDGSTALHAAAANNDGPSAVECLLAHGADIHAISQYGHTALSLAAWNRHGETVKFLLRHGADVHTATQTGETVLHKAALGINDPDVIECLLAHGAAVNATDQNGHTPLFIAAREGHAACVTLLVRRGADVEAVTTDSWRTVLHAAAREIDDPGVLARLLELGVDINAPDEQGSTALHEAALNCRAQGVEFLVCRGADVNAAMWDGTTPLHSAATVRPNPRTLAFLLDHGADVLAADEVSEDGVTALYYAARIGNAEGMRLLLERGADARATTRMGGTIEWTVGRSHNVAAAMRVLQELG